MKAKIHALIERDICAFLFLRRCIQGMGLLIAALFVLFLGLQTCDAKTAALSAYCVLPGWLAGTSLLALCDLHRTRKSRLRKSLPRLSRYSVTQSVGVLTELLMVNDACLTPIAAAGLTALLPRVETLHHPVLTRRQRACLYRTLTGSNARVIFATLNVLEKQAETEAILPVRRLTECPHWIAESRQIRRAASVCLAVLEAKAEAQQARKLLLRPVTNIFADSLLRPVNSLHCCDARQLLRPASPE